MSPRLRKEKVDGLPLPTTTPVAADKAVATGPTGRGHSGGGAMSSRIDTPNRFMGMPPHKTINGEPSMSPDVNASELMQNKIMGDDDRKWYDELFQKMDRHFLEPRDTVHNQPNVPLSACLHHGELIEGYNDTSSCGVFIAVPPDIARKVEAAYPAISLTNAKDDSPMHITLLYIGDLDPHQVEMTKNILAAVLDAQPSFRVDIAGTDFFYNDERDIFHIKAVGKELANMHYHLKSTLLAAGIPVTHDYGPDGGQEFSGHITLGYLQKGESPEHIPFTGGWAVDRIEMWGTRSPISIKLGKQDNMACTPRDINLENKDLRRFINLTLREEKGILAEPDDVDEDDDQEQTTEFNAVATGAISGYTLPLGASNQPSSASRKNAKINARAFADGKIEGK